MKIFLQFVLPIILPGLMFLIWTLLTQASAGQVTPARTRVIGGPWFWLIIAGFALMLIVLATAAITGGMDPGGEYRSPYQENGKIIPGGVIRNQP